MKLMYPEAVLLKRISEQQNVNWISFTETFSGIFGAKFLQTVQSLGPSELKLCLDSWQQDKATQGFPTFWRFFVRQSMFVYVTHFITQSVLHWDTQSRR